MIEASIHKIKETALKSYPDLDILHMICTLEVLVKMGLLTRQYKAKGKYYPNLDSVPDSTKLEDLELVFGQGS